MPGMRDSFPAQSSKELALNFLTPTIPHVPRKLLQTWFHNFLQKLTRTYPSDVAESNTRHNGSKRKLNFTNLAKQNTDIDLKTQR